MIRFLDVHENPFHLGATARVVGDDREGIVTRFTLPDIYHKHARVFVGTEEFACLHLLVKGEDVDHICTFLEKA